jgi:hypothetical protein
MDEAAMLMPEVFDNGALGNVAEDARYIGRKNQ